MLPGGEQGPLLSAPRRRALSAPQLRCSLAAFAPPGALSLGAVPGMGGGWGFSEGPWVPSWLSGSSPPPTPHPRPVQRPESASLFELLKCDPEPLGLPANDRGSGFGLGSCTGRRGLLPHAPPASSGLGAPPASAVGTGGCAPPSQASRTPKHRTDTRSETSFLPLLPGGSPQSLAWASLTVFGGSSRRVPAISGVLLWSPP